MVNAKIGYSNRPMTEKKNFIMLYLYETMTVLMRPKSLSEMYMERDTKKVGDQIKLVTCFGCLYSWVLCCVNDS